MLVLLALAVGLLEIGCGGGRGGVVVARRAREGAGAVVAADALGPASGGVRSADVARQAEARAAPVSTGGAPIPRRYASALGAGASPVATEADAARDRGRREDLVTIKLTVDPPRLAHVFWGVKDLGLAPLELRRPRGSGPLDLVVRAPGYLVHHTRVFTDRNDGLSIHLAPETDGARYPGYRAPEHAGKPAAPSPKGIAKRTAPATLFRAAGARGTGAPIGTLSSGKPGGVTPAPPESAQTPPPDEPSTASSPATDEQDDEPSPGP